MMIFAPITSRNLLAVLIGLAFSACRNSNNIPLPQTETGFETPKAVAIKVGPEKQFNWPDSVVQLRPVTRKINLNKLPERLFDTTGFNPLSQPPTKLALNQTQLPDTPFNYSALPTDTMDFDFFLLDPPTWIPTGKPRLNNTLSENIYELGEPFSRVNISFIFQDRDHFLWIATDQALYRYDGQNVYLIYRFNDGQIVSNMLEDDNGQLWIGLRARNNVPASKWNPYEVLDRKKGILKRLKLFKGQLEKQVVGVVKMTFDNQGKIWATRGNDMVDIVDPQNGTIKHLDRKNGMRGLFAVGILNDKKGNIWIESFLGGIMIVNPEKNKLSYLDQAHGLASDSVTAILQDQNKNIWIGFYTGRIEMIDSQYNSISSYPVPQHFRNRIIWTIAEGNDNNIWTGTISENDVGNGIMIIDPRLNRFKTITVENGLSSNHIERLILDNQGQIWAATQNGVNMLNKQGIAVERIGKQGISTLIEDKAGRIWTGTLSNGLTISNPEKTKSKIYSTASGFSNNLVQNISMLSNQTMAVGTNGGIDFFDESISSIQHLDKSRGLTNDSVGNFTIDHNDRMWFAPNSRSNTGLYVIDPVKFTMIHIGASQGLGDTAIGDIKEDLQNRMWILTARPGSLAIIDPTRKTIRRLEGLKGLEQTYNKMFKADALGNMWLGTGTGLARISKNLDSVIYFSEKEGLPADQIISINEYNGKIYAGTRSGFSILTAPEISPDGKWSLENYGRDLGLTKVANSYNSDMVSSQGDFWWGDAGATVIKKTNKDTTVPATYVQGFTVMNQEMSFNDRPWDATDAKDTIRSYSNDTFYTRGRLPSIGYYSFTHFKWDSTEGPYNLPVNLRIPYDQNYLQFHFIQSHLGKNDSAWYRYILEGVDKKWSARTSNPYSENYMNLGSGDYTFKVSSLYNGRWQEPTSFSFTITPPWWQSWWAYCLYVIGAAATITLITMYRSRQLKRENFILEQKVQQRTIELKKSLENLQLAQNQLVQSEKMASLGELTAGIAHEIQNPLNFVNNFSEVNTELIDELKKGPIQKLTGRDKDEADELLEDMLQNMNKITHHGKRADGIVKGMLQHSRTSAGTKEPTDINSLADEYLRLSYHGLRAKDKSFNTNIETHFDESVGKIDVIPQDLGRVLLNLFNNAFYAVTEKKKLAGDQYKPTVTVSTKKSGSRTEISIRDNGIGIPQKVMDKIFQPFFTTKPSGQGTGLGLSLSYDIITKGHGGELKVETKEGEGASFVIILPNRV